MTNIDLIFEDEFLKSKEYNEWYDSLLDIINLRLEPVNEFLDKHVPVNPNKECPYTESEINELKSRINELKVAHVTKSIELGLFFKELENK